MMIELNRRFTLTAPQGAISDSGIVDILHFLGAQRLQEGDWKTLNAQTGYYYLPALPDNWQWVWVVTDKADYVGTFPKRVKNYYFKKYALKSPQKFLEELGNIARRHSETRPSYTFDFTDTFDWSAGAFGDYSSCFFGSRYHAFDILRENGALAIRFYDQNGHGHARAWIARADDFYVVFNGYGFPGDPTVIIARAFAYHVGLHYRKIRLDNYGETSGTLWIDNGTGYAIGQPERLTFSGYDLEWPDPYANRCENCDSPIDEDNSHYGPDGQIYCESCFYRFWDNCSYCGETVDRDEITPVGYDYMCRDCLERFCTVCDSCGEFVRNRDAHSVKEKTYCENCYHQ